MQEAKCNTAPPPRGLEGGLYSPRVTPSAHSLALSHCLPGRPSLPWDSRVAPPPQQYRRPRRRVLQAGEDPSSA